MGDTFIIPPDPEQYKSVAQLVTENFSDKYGQKMSPQTVGIVFKCQKHNYQLIILQQI